MERASGPAPDGSCAPGADAETANQLRAACGANFRTARLKTGLTPREMEACTGIQHHISLIENGQRDLTLDTMTTLARAVGKHVRTPLKPR